MIEIDSNEKIIRIVRKHWFVLLADFFVLLFFIVIPVLLLFLLQIVPIDSILNYSGDAFYAKAFFLFAWLFLVWMFGWNMWTDYYLDVLIVTNNRIFDITQEGLFKRTSSSFRIDKIQNVTVDQKGIIETLFDFGTIKLETAGEREDFVASYITNPYEIKKFVNEMQDKEVERSQLVHLDNAPPKGESTESSNSLTQDNKSGLS